MRITTKLSLLSLAMLLCFTAVNAQNLGRLTFSQSTGNTYTDITGGTQITTDNDDGTWTSQSIGFTFTFNGADYTTFSVSANCYMQFGNTIQTDYYNSLSSTSAANVVSAMGSDCRLYSANSCELRYQTLGSSPNRVLVIQWKNVSPYGTSANYMNVQIRLYETSNKIEICWGASTMSTSQNRTYQVGIKGPSSGTDYQNRSVLNGTNTWSTSTNGTSLTASCYQSESLYPPSGLIYRWEEVPMSFVSSNVYQITGRVPRGSLNQPVVALEVVTTGFVNALNVSNINISTNGTTRLGDIANVRVYYTGTSGVFNTDNQYGNTVATPGANFSVAGDLTLKPGNNYFWITYDVLSTAVLNNYVDAEIPSVTVSGVNRTPTTTAPYGDRQIADPLEGTYTVGNGGYYANLAAMFTDLNQLGMKGSCVASIISDLNEGTGAQLLQWPEVGSGNYTLTVQPNGAARTISASGSAVLWFHGADRVTVDGRLNGSGRNLTIQNLSATGAGIIFTRSELASVGGATNNTIRNCNIMAGSNSSTSAYGVFMGSTTASNGIAGEDNIKNSLLENQISRAYYGLYAYKGSSDKDMSDLLVKNNIFGSDIAAQYIYFRSIYMNALKDAKIIGNDIYNMKVSPGTNIAAVHLLGNNTGNLIEANKIHGIYNLSTGGWGGWGLLIEAGSGITVANNFMWDFMGINYSGTTYQAYPIRMTGGSNHKIYNNSLNMTGTLSISSTAPTTACMVITSALTGLDVRNNIFRNYMTSTVSGAKSYAVYLSSAVSFQNIDYNIYNVGGPYGVLGYYAADKLTLPDWQASSTKDANSRTAGFSFASDTDLHLYNGWNTSTAPPLTGASTDIDGETRRTTNTNIGADEVIPFMGAQQDLTQFSNVFCEGNDADLSFVPMISSYGDGINRPSLTGLTSMCEYTWYRDGKEVSNPNSNTFSNSTSNVFTIRGMKPEDAKTYRVDVDFFGAPTYSSRNSTVVMEFPISITQQPVGAETCQDRATHKLSVQTTGTIYGEGAYPGNIGFQWQKEDPNNAGMYFDLPYANNANYTVSLSNPKAATGNYRVKVLGPGNCGPATVISNPVYLFVAEPLSDVMATVNFADPMFICNGEDVIFDATANGTITGYQWQKSSDGKVFSDIEIAKNQTAKSAKLILPKATVMETGYYRCMVSGHQNCDETVLPTQDIQILVWPFFEITEHPKSEVVCLSNEVVLNVVPNGKVLEDKDGYQWQKDGINIDPKVNPTAKDPILIISNANYDHSGSYRCVIHFEDCRGQLYTTSNEAQVYVLRETEFVHQPESQMSELGGTAMFTFDAHIYDYPPQYQPDIQWYRGATPLVESERITGVKSSILTIRDIQAGDFASDYHVQLVGKCGDAVSDNFGLAEKAKIDIVTQPQSIDECEGTDVQFQFVINITGTLNMPTYSWFKDGVALANGGKYSGTDTETLTISSPTAAEVGSYYCYVMVQTAPGLFVDATSDMAMLTLKQAPMFTMQPPAVLNVETGRELKLEVAATGFDPIGYQWQKDGADLTGETMATLTIASATTTDAGTYACVVTNQCGTITSTPCVVTVQLQGTTDVNDPVAGGYMLLESIPNPVNSVATISYLMPVSANVKITLTDAQGREIALLANNYVSAGSHDIEININELNLSNGVYFYTMTTNGYSSTKKLVVAK